MRYLFVLLLPLLLFSKPFKVATYNVENLFDAKYTGREYDDYRKSHNWTERMVEIKLNHTAEVICDLDADIIGLQEIESRDIFKRLQTRLKRVGCGYRYGAITSKHNAPIQVALLSRFPIKKQKELQVSYSPRVRNILEVQVDVKGEPLWILVNHWKSKAYEGVESKRMKYAKVLKKRLDGFSHAKPYIILGDFNTDYDAHLGLERRINDTKGQTGLHHILKLTKEKTLIQEKDMLQKERGYHYTLWNELHIEDRWNIKFYGKKGTPDHILLPPSLFDSKGIEYVNNSFGVFKKRYLFTKKGYINRWQYKKGKHLGKGYSDHLPVYALFDTRPYKAGTDNVRKKPLRITKKIEYFYTTEDLENEVRLDDAVVVWKERQNALIKQSKEGRGIFLYGCAGNLEEGQRYDLLVKAMKNYKGLKELTQVYVLEEKGKIDISPYLVKSSELLKSIAYRQNEVIEDLTGVYNKKYFYIQGRKIPIYFKNKKSTPPNGAKLKIDKALLGYYKGLQLVIYNTNDFEILER